MPCSDRYLYGKRFQGKGQMFVNSESSWGISAPFSVETSFVDTLKGLEMVAEVQASHEFLFSKTNHIDLNGSD